MRGENAIQAAIMEYLRLTLPASCFAFHVNNTPRNSIHGARLKHLGLVAGVPDIVVLRSPGLCAFIEVKTAKGTLSNSQKAFRDWCAENGFPFAVVRGVGDVQAFLTDMNIPLKARAAA